MNLNNEVVKLLTELIRFKSVTPDMTECQRYIDDYLSQSNFKTEYKKYKNIEILWASTREAYNYTQAKQLNCQIITMPPKIINQITTFGKSFNQLTLETVKGFLNDSKKSKFRL